MPNAFISICVIQTTNTDNETVQTVTLPVTNKVIVVDAGHGVPDEGIRKLTLTE